jgi:hypothetical protein
VTLEASLPPHLAAMQSLINRCPTSEKRKEFIISAFCCGAATAEDTGLLIQANQLETA